MPSHGAGGNGEFGWLLRRALCGSDLPACRRRLVWGAAGEQLFAALSACVAALSRRARAGLLAASTRTCGAGEANWPRRVGFLRPFCLPCLLWPCWWRAPCASCRLRAPLRSDGARGLRLQCCVLHADSSSFAAGFFLRCSLSELARRALVCGAAALLRRVRPVHPAAARGIGADICAVGEAAVLVSPLVLALSLPRCRW